MGGLFDGETLEEKGQFRPVAKGDVGNDGIKVVLILLRRAQVLGIALALDPEYVHDLVGVPGVGPRIHAEVHHLVEQM